MTIVRETNDENNTEKQKKKNVAKRAAADPADVYVIFVNDQTYDLTAENITINLTLSTTNNIAIAKRVGEQGYGMKTDLDTVVTGAILYNFGIKCVFLPFESSI